MQSTTLTKAGAAALHPARGRLRGHEGADRQPDELHDGQLSHAAEGRKLRKRLTQVQPNGERDCSRLAHADDPRQSTPRQLQAAQQALERAGYNPGNATGTMDAADARCAPAIPAGARPPKATGDLDSSTMSALGVPTAVAYDRNVKRRRAPQSVPFFFQAWRSGRDSNPRPPA